MRRYMLRLEAYGISRARVRELTALCLQYDEFRRRAEEIRRGVEDRRPVRGGAWRPPDPTGNAAVHAAENYYTRRIRAIEQAARDAEPSIAAYILRNMCRGVAFTRLGAPCGERYFYEARRRFLVLLDVNLRRGEHG